MRQIIRADKALEAWIAEDVWRWTNERVGTVRTV